MFADPLHLSQHQRTPSTPPLSSSCSSYHNSRLKTSNPCNHRNQQYSIIGLTNAAGTLVERYSYTAYGTLGIYDASGTVRTNSTYANRYTYTGREYDSDLNLYHFRARWYDPTTGGFISRDPLGYVDGMSLYRGYFGPANIDPYGQQDGVPPRSFPGFPHGHGGFPTPFPGAPFPTRPSSPLPPLPPVPPPVIKSPGLIISLLTNGNYPSKLRCMRDCRKIAVGAAAYNECLKTCYTFVDWFDLQVSRAAEIDATLAGLPDCPCALPTNCLISNTGVMHFTPVLPESLYGEEWDWDWAKTRGLTEIYVVLDKGWGGFHPGAEYCIRSNNGSMTEPNQQCCYDIDFNLITAGPGAGTPDINKGGHWPDEVTPFNAAIELDGGVIANPGFYAWWFNIFRQPNNGNGCRFNKKP